MRAQVATSVYPSLQLEVQLISRALDPVVKKLGRNAPTLTIEVQTAFNLDEVKGNPIS